MSDERLRDLARRAAAGDPEAEAALERARRRAHVHECRMDYAGKVEKGKRYLARAFCWTCGRMKLFGDMDLLGLLQEKVGEDLGVGDLLPHTTYGFVPTDSSRRASRRTRARRPRPPRLS